MFLPFSTKYKAIFFHGSLSYFFFDDFITKYFKFLSLCLPSCSVAGISTKEKKERQILQLPYLAPGVSYRLHDRPAAPLNCAFGGFSAICFAYLSADHGVGGFAVILTRF